VAYSSEIVEEFHISYVFEKYSRENSMKQIMPDSQNHCKLKYRKTV